MSQLKRYNGTSWEYVGGTVKQSDIKTITVSGTTNTNSELEIPNTTINPTNANIISTFSSNYITSITTNSSDTNYLIEFRRRGTNFVKPGQSISVSATVNYIDK